MVQLTLAAGLDRYNRVLACRDTFLTDLVREALTLGRFDRSLVEALDRDIEMAARGEKKVRLMDWQAKLTGMDCKSAVVERWLEALELQAPVAKQLGNRRTGHQAKGTGADPARPCTFPQTALGGRAHA